MQNSSLKVYVYRDFIDGLNKLQRGSGIDANAAMKAKAALFDAQMTGKITFDFARHGESRIDKVEKYRLSDSHRLIVQIVDGNDRERAFLFVGNHSDSEHWLDTHRNYQWVYDRKSNEMQFCQVTTSVKNEFVWEEKKKIQESKPIDTRKLFAGCDDELLEELNKVPRIKEIINDIKCSDLENEQDYLLGLANELGEDEGCTFLDMCVHANNNEWNKVKSRLFIYTKRAEIKPQEDLSDAFSVSTSNESLIDLNDIDFDAVMNSKSAISDWMVFLHPKQRQIASAKLNGPSRVRGVAGSGKTSLIVHRSRELAKRYSLPIQILTLTESTQKLMKKLVSDLIHDKPYPIYYNTFSSFSSLISDIVFPEYQQENRAIKKAESKIFIEKIYKECLADKFPVSSKYRSISYKYGLSIFEDEIFEIRTKWMRLERHSEFEIIRNDRSTLEKVAKNSSDHLGLEYAVEAYEKLLRKNHFFDHSERINVILEVIAKRNFRHEFDKYFRCILVDEAQDLSQLDLKLLSVIPTSHGLISKIPDGLFFCGDEMQQIINRGFTFKRAGIDIVGRSYVFDKNYRNTYEVFESAFELVRDKKFSSLGDDESVSAAKGNASRKSGSFPVLSIYSTVDEEITKVSDQIKALVKSGIIGGQICIISSSLQYREMMKKKLSAKRIEVVDLKSDANYLSSSVKISTIESAKGHEFYAVFVVGISEMDKLYAKNEKLKKREFSRLYVAMTRAREKLCLSLTGEKEATEKILPELFKSCEVIVPPHA